jgi:hypothetical protein
VRVALRLAAGALVALAVAGPAAAAVPFSRADANHDGFVSWPEAHRVFPKLKQIHFEKCDPSGDGLIDQQEYPLLSTFYWQNYIMAN